MSRFTFKLLRRKIWVKQTITYHGLYSKVWNSFVELTDEQAEEIDAWVKTTGCGRRVAYDRWLLDSKESIMLFRLRWAA